MNVRFFSSLALLFILMSGVAIAQTTREYYNELRDSNSLNHYADQCASVGKSRSSTFHCGFQIVSLVCLFRCLILEIAWESLTKVSIYKDLLRNCR